MSEQRKGSMTRPRRVGLALAGLAAAGLAAASGTALASSSSSAGSMAGTQMSSTAARHVGATKGFYGGKTVTFYYTKNFRCANPPASHAKSKCEGGTDYTQTPARTFDPLYVIVPLGFTPSAKTLQCTRRQRQERAVAGPQPHRGHR
jgi:hypothetical protein